MRSPLLVTLSHTEPVFHGCEFSAALERVTVALYLLANREDVVPERRAKVKIAARADENGTPALIVGSLLCRGRDVPDPEPLDPWADVTGDPEGWLPLVTTGEVTA